MFSLKKRGRRLQMYVNAKKCWHVVKYLQIVENVCNVCVFCFKRREFPQQVQVPSTTWLCEPQVFKKYLRICFKVFEDLLKKVLEDLFKKKLRICLKKVFEDFFKKYLGICLKQTLLYLSWEGYMMVPKIEWLKYFLFTLLCPGRPPKKGELANFVFYDNLATYGI